MENSELENDTLNNEEDQDLNLEEESKEDMVKKEAYENQKIRAEKAEKKLKEIEAQLSEKPENKTPKNKQSDESDYTKEMVEDTFMESKGFTLDEQKSFLKKEAKSTGKSLKDLIGFKYVQEELKNINDQAEAQAGMPKGSGKGGGSGKRDVDYYIAKGETPADVDLANEVINARIKQETESTMFSEQMFNE